MRACGCCEISVLVGAPRDNGTSTWRLGMLYQCPLTSLTDDCSRIDVDWQNLIGTYANRPTRTFAPTHSEAEYCDNNNNK